jgi:hypothetical protein
MYYDQPSTQVEPGHQPAPDDATDDDQPTSRPIDRPPSQSGGFWESIDIILGSLAGLF